MDLSIFLAQAQTQSNGVSNAVVAVVSLLFGGGVVGTVAMFAARGYWAKNIEPMIQAAILAWYTSEEQVRSRRMKIEDAVSGWHTSPEQIQVRKRFVRDEIDNHIRRDDGLIHLEIKTRVEQGVQPLQQNMIEIKELLRQKGQDEAAFREAVLMKLAHLEGLWGASPLRAETPVHTPSRPFPKPQPPSR